MEDCELYIHNLNDGQLFPTWAPHIVSDPPGVPAEGCVHSAQLAWHLHHTKSKPDTRKPKPATYGPILWLRGGCVKQNVWVWRLPAASSSAAILPSRPTNQNETHPCWSASLATNQATLSPDWDESCRCCGLKGSFEGKVDSLGLVQLLFFTHWLSAFLSEGFLIEREKQSSFKTRILSV